MSAPTTREACVAADHPLVGTDDGRYGPDTVDRCFCGQVSTVNNFGLIMRAADRRDPAGDAGRISAGIRNLSKWLDASYPEAVTSVTELHWRRRIDKIGEEYGEVVAALGGAFAENPRKGYTHTRGDIEYELLDVATAALGALVSMHNNDPGFDPVEDLARHVEAVAARAGLL